MSETSRVGDLVVTQDREFQQRSWMVQRIGWVIMLIIVVAALLGVFGRGMLSHATAGHADGPVYIEYERFTRHQSATTLRLHLAPGLAQKGMLRVMLGRDYIQGVNLRDITPEPDFVDAGHEWLVYAFRVLDPTEPVIIVFHIEPDASGLRSGQVGLEGWLPVEFWQFVFP